MADILGEMDILRFLPYPRIIAVDNDPDHLELIRKGLFRLGLPCIPIPYDTAEGLARPERWNAERLRVVFLDLNLSDIENPGASFGSVVGPIGEVLRALAPSGPYLIIFWTEHADWVEDTMKHLAEREQDAPLPAGFTTLDKKPFIPVEGDHDLEALERAILTALLKHRLFLAMLAWESEVEGAAVRTFNRVHSLVASGQADGKAQNDETLQDIIKKLAMEAWGETNAKEDPGAATASGLAPLLLDHLDLMIGNDEYTRIWKEAIAGEWKKKLPEGVSPASLNAQCLVDLHSKDRKYRGTWLEFAEAAFTPGSPLQECFGKNKDELAKEFADPKAASNAEEIWNSVNLGLLECTAACDYNNNKAPLRRFILSARIPADAMQNCKERPSHEAIYRFGLIAMEEGGEFYLSVNFRYSLSLPNSHPLLTLAEPIFRVRNQVLTDISSRYAAHTTRSGFYAFTS